MNEDKLEIPESSLVGKSRIRNETRHNNLLFFELIVCEWQRELGRLQDIWAGWDEWI